VLNRIDLRGSRRDPRGLLPRAQLDVAAAVETIRPVVAAVREHGFPAISEATKRFDGIELERLRVPAEAITAAVEVLDPDVRAALLVSIERARKEKQEQDRHRRGQRGDTTSRTLTAKSANRPARSAPSAPARRREARP